MGKGEQGLPWPSVGGVAEAGAGTFQSSLKPPKAVS